MMAGTREDEPMHGEEPSGASPGEVGPGEVELPFLALAEDWLTAQDALLSYIDHEREMEIQELRRGWDQGTLVVDAGAVADRLLGVSRQASQQNCPTWPVDPGETS